MVPTEPKVNYQISSAVPCMIIPYYLLAYLSVYYYYVIQIRFSHIDFWTKDYGSLKLMHKNKIYPYRVILTVTMKDSQFVLPVKSQEVHGCMLNGQSIG
jgi:hypothetical protein